MTPPKQSVAVRALVAAACLAAAGGAEARPAGAQPADPRDARIEALVRQVEALTARVDTLQAKAEAEAPPAPPPAPIQTLAPPPLPSAGVTITAGKPQIQSGDGRFAANLHGAMQFDAADYSQRTPGPITSDFRRGAAAGDTAHARDLSSGANFRRARIGIDGKAFGDFEYNLLFEFGGAGEEDAGHIQEMWVQYSGYKPFHLKVGAFPPSIGLEDQASTNGALFLERPASADMARSLAGGDFREAVQLWAAGERWYASGAITGRVVGVVNSQATGVSQPFDSSLGLIGRAAFVPIRTDDALVHLGAHGSYVARPADTGGPDTVGTAVRYGITLQERPELRVDGTRLISTGAVDARHARTLGFEAAGQYQSFFLQAEYERFDIDRRNVAAGISDPDFKGYYVEGSWIATGERRRYNPGTFAFDAPLVDHPFSLSEGTWGALELAGRYSVANLNYHQGLAGASAPVDGVRGGEQRIFAAGLNWYPNTFVRLLLDYQDVRVRRLSPSAATFSTPAGAQVGQHYHAISLRSQFAF
ncbi:OprO/OprP family phosphate-selective porin [Phenylobacterium sp.]|uniref:OprO/OprP family phosphate-selective porin n=1 Tax=Phenylobacterium sp. TaxID=1871053 RepID=UPI002F3ED1E3